MSLVETRPPTVKAVEAYNWSFFEDIKILSKTIYIVLGGKLSK